MSNFFLFFWLFTTCLILDLLPWTPPIIKRTISSWQGFAAGAVALGVYLWLPSYILRIDPTAGIYDAGFLQWIGLSVVLFFLGIFVTWAGWQIAWRSLDEAADRYLAVWFEDFKPRHRWILAQGTFLLMLAYWVVCLKIVPYLPAVR
jgi:hypothetical protein